MAEERQILKDKIKLKKEIGLKEAQIDATTKSKDEKIAENDNVEKDIAEVEQDNIKLEEQIQGLEEQIAELDKEFKEAQLTAGKLRKMMKMSAGKAETEEANIKKLTKDLDALSETLDRLRRDIKREVDERKNLEYQVKTTKARIEEMEGKFMARLLVTRRIKKDERFYPKGITPEELAAEAAERAEKEREEAEAAAARARASKAEEAKARAEAKAAEAEKQGGPKKAEEVTEEDLDLTM
jgi:chromosome segregation ATPase